MILAIYGTTGELIKLAPVLSRLHDRGHDYLSATTAQQVEQIPSFLRMFGLPDPTAWLASGAGGRDLRTNRDIPGWLAQVTRRFVRSRKPLRTALGAGPGKPLVLVHGDTMTTVLGALMGRLLGATVAHVESGLRSFDLRHPFPEELNRRLTSSLAAIHYAPGAWAASNLRRGTVVDTGSNTIRDSLAMCPADVAARVPVPDGQFGLVSLHRFELLNDERLLRQTLSLLSDHARQVPLLFVDHPVTAAAIERSRLDSLFHDGFMRMPRASFFEFIALLRQASFVVTDSGGSQEESFYLDLPCLVHRKRTERNEGLGENVVLSGYDERVLASFLEAPDRFRRQTELPLGSPSEVIVSDLEQRGFSAPTRVR